MLHGSKARREVCCQMQLGNGVFGDGVRCGHRRRGDAGAGHGDGWGHVRAKVCERWRRRLRRRHGRVHNEVAGDGDGAGYGVCGGTETHWLLIGGGDLGTFVFDGCLLGRRICRDREILLLAVCSLLLLRFWHFTVLAFFCHWL